jgi:hypothetical protein
MLNLLPRHVPRCFCHARWWRLGILTLTFLALLSFSIGLLLPLVVIFARYKDTGNPTTSNEDVFSVSQQAGFLVGLACVAHI